MSGGCTDVCGLATDAQKGVRGGGVIQGWGFRVNTIIVKGVNFKQGGGGFSHPSV